MEHYIIQKKGSMSMVGYVMRKRGLCLLVRYVIQYAEILLS